MDHIQLVGLTEGQRKWGVVTPLVLFTVLWAFLLQWNVLFSLPTEGLTLETLRAIGLFVTLLATAFAAILRGVQAHEE